MDHSNQCHFMKVAGDDGNPANAPDIIDIDPNAANFSPSQQPTNLPTRERSHTAGSYLPPGLVPHSFSAYGPPPDMDTSSSNDLSGASADGQSNRPTPNSSTTGGTSSDRQRQNSNNNNNNNNLAAPGNGHVNGSSGRTSFETSPVPSHQTLGGSSMSGTTPGFFGDPSSSFVGMAAAGLTPPDHQRFGSIPGGDNTAGGGGGERGRGSGGGGGAGEFAGHAWAGMAAGPHHQGMAPVADGVLRSIMALGNMDGMEMGWEAS
jgi:hypothetical protein